MTKNIYLDYAAATPLDDGVLKKILPFFSEDFYNPSANYSKSKLVKEKVNEGWSEGSKYVSKNACQLGVSTFVTGAVGTIMTTEKELDFRYKLVDIILQKSTDGIEGKRKAIAELSKEASKTLITLIYTIPGIPGSEDEVEDVVAFLIYKSLSDDNANINSLKDLWSGALACGITSYICDGSLPQGYSDWKSGKL